jgi:N-acetylmuramoyl-L-alanine amidase
MSPNPPLTNKRKTLPKLAGITFVAFASFFFVLNQPGLGQSINPTSAAAIHISYPTPQTKVDAGASFIVGSCTPGDALSCDGQAVRLSKDGFFAHIVPLKQGANQFTLIESGKQNITRSVYVYRRPEPPMVPATKLAIIGDSFSPAQDLALEPGDTINLCVRATPGAVVAVEVADKTILLRPLSQSSASRKNSGGSNAQTKSVPTGKDIEVNSGLSVTYGKPVQRASSTRPDTYYGFYKISSSDCWKAVHPQVKAEIGNTSIVFISKANWVVLKSPLLAETSHDDTVVRVAPNASRTTPLAKGVRLLVDGWQGDQIRCRYAANRHVWLTREDLTWENASDQATTRFAGVAGPEPSAIARTINVGNDNFGSYISLPLSQRLPYEVIQSIKPNTIVLKLYGVTSDIDWMSDPATRDDLGNGPTNALVKDVLAKDVLAKDVLAKDGPAKDGPAKDDLGKDGFTKNNSAKLNLATDTLIDSIASSQPTDGQYQIVVSLRGQRQWGYKVEYQGSELRLHLRRAPQLDKTDPAKPLAGLSICLDPGHGGKEHGAVGPSGITESGVNLAIALRLKGLLENAGAKVFMTREGDQEVSLADRVQIANRNNVDILLSVHNNSLPDGRDPWHEHGSSTYWYQPQSTELANSLKNGLIASLHLSDLGNRFQNLALARPSSMPAVLAEVGFMINPDEYSILISPEGQQAAAVGLYNGLVTYLK